MEIEIKLTIATDLMLKCIKSCELPEQLQLTIEWMDKVLTKERFPNEDAINISVARVVIFKEAARQEGRIFGVNDEMEVDLKAGTIHPQ